MMTNKNQVYGPTTGNHDNAAGKLYGDPTASHGEPMSVCDKLDSLLEKLARERLSVD